MNFSFGSNLAPKTTAAGFSLVSGTTTTQAGTATTIPATGQSLGTGFSFGGAGDSNKPTSLSFSTATTTVPASTVAPQQPPTGFSLLPAATSAAPTLGFSLTSTAAATTTPSSSSTLKLAAGSTTSVSTSQPAIQTTIPATLATTTTVTSAPTAGTPSSSINFVQLEETINKWTVELEEQEKLFINQATQINAWDKLLVSNSEKIVDLNNSVESVKLQQQQLDHELDFIRGQQRELEECLVPLEKELASTPVHIDPQREHMYHMAEGMDTQLKQMSEDLKEIIEHLNESSRTQDTSDPIVQIGRILNAHMNSLQWIDENVILIQNKLDEVSKLHDLHRRENERSFRSTYK